MDTSKALLAIQNYYDIENPTADDEFIYTESLKIMITETKDPKYMAELAWFYCDRKRFDLEIKYLEMAAECVYGPACEKLGYMWYFGQHGEKDYKKAFEYFTTGSETDKYGNEGSLWAKYKLADMYRFGLSVEKNEEKYRDLIEEAYEKVKHPVYLNEPFPEISLRMAGILSTEGRIDEAMQMLRDAKRFMAERLLRDAFWGHIEVMGRIVRFFYKLKASCEAEIPFKMPEPHWDFYDLFYLTEEPGTYVLSYLDRNTEKKIRIEAVLDEETDSSKDQGKAPTENLAETATISNPHIAIKYDGKWFRNFNEFCSKARLSDRKFTTIYDEFYKIEIIRK